MADARGVLAHPASVAHPAPGAAAPPSQFGGPGLYSRSDERAAVSRARVAPAVKGFGGRWVRWGWLATTVALGAALAGTAWMGRRRAVAAAATLNRGQSQVLFESVRQQARTMADPPTPADLDSLLRQHQAAGLRYLAFFDQSGAEVAQVGEAATPVHVPVRPPPGPPALQQIGDRVRLWGFAGFEPPPPGGRRSGAPRPRRLTFVMEFEPLVAERLAAEATNTFVLSLVMAAALIAAAVVFLRLSVRQERTEHRLEQQRRLGALGEMSAVLAHELRNPLASLKGHAQLLIERLAPGSQEREKAELVVDEAQRLEALTSDLLDFARSGPIDLKPTDPAALLASCIEEVASDGFVIRRGVPTPEWPLDADRLRQALTNVLRNARQASPDGSRPEVEVGREDGTLVFTVRDFGPGVAPGDEKKIFAPFFTTRTSGTGLGLTVALRVAEMHRGTITVNNHPEGGAIFRIVIPG
jgi:two-component system sensor histidine kinase HydH